MVADVSIADVEVVLKKYYSKIYEGYEVVSVSCSREKHTSYASSWDEFDVDYYVLTGKLLLSKKIGDLHCGEPILFNVSLTNEEVKEAVLLSFNEMMNPDGIEISTFSVDKKGVTLYTKSLQKKQYVKQDRKKVV